MAARAKNAKGGGCGDMNICRTAGGQFKSFPTSRKSKALAKKKSKSKAHRGKGSHRAAKKSAKKSAKGKKK